MQNMNEIEAFVLQHGLSGPAYSESVNTWDDCHRIASNSALPLAERARAVRFFDVLTGEVEAVGDDMQVVADYSKDHSRVFVPGIQADEENEHGNYLEFQDGTLHITAGEPELNIQSQNITIQKSVADSFQAEMNRLNPELEAMPYHHQHLHIEHEAGE